MKRRIVLPNVMTALGLTLGLFIIFKLSVLPPEAVTLEQLSSCLVLFLIAAIIDTIDGALARAMKLESDFGGLFDSMSDAVTFGVAPSVFVLKAFPLMPGSIESMLLLISATAYSVAGVLRLVRFSTSHVLPEHKSTFTGLPIPAAAFTVVSLALMIASYSSQWGLDMKKMAWVMMGASFFIAYMMISRWRFPSLKAINIRMHSFLFIAFLACVAVFFLALVSNSIPIAVLVVSWGYFSLSWLVAVYRLMSGKRALAINDSSDLEEDPKHTQTPFQDD